MTNHLVCQQQAGTGGSVYPYRVNVENKGKSEKWQDDSVKTGKKGKEASICWVVTMYNSFTTHLNAYYVPGIVSSSEQNEDTLIIKKNN